MTPKRDIEMTVAESKRFRNFIIKTVAGISIAGVLTTAGTSYLTITKTALGQERITTDIEELKKDVQRKASIEMILQVKEDLRDDMTGIKTDIKELRNLLITKLK